MRVKAVASLLVALLISPGAWSAVVISNDSVNDAVQTIFPGTGGIQGTKGMGFTMGPLSFELDSVDLRLCFDNVVAGCFPAANGSVGTPVLRLFSDAAGLPSNELLTFVNPVFGFGIEDYTFVPSAPFTLNAGTAYWLVLHSEDGGDFSWLANNPQTIPAGAFASHLGMKTGGDAPEPPTSSSTFLNIYAVHGTQVVPEPSAALLLLAGSALFIWRRSMFRTKSGREISSTL
jgi:hypothetical protein